MDQIKTGQFIKACRTEKGMTQQELADKLAVSFKTVSKWECGNGLPEVSLMLPLCKELGITVNELLSGCKINQEDYKAKAEENFVSIMEERKQNINRLWLAIAVSILTLIGGFIPFFTASFIEMPDYARILLIVLGFIELVFGLIICCIIDRKAGYFECRNCHELFVPTLGAYIAGPHTITTRTLKCPHCGKVTICKKRFDRRSL